MNKNVLSYVRACKACSDRGWYSDLVTITADCGEDQIDVDVVFGYRPFAAEPDVGIMERYPEVYAVYLVDHDVYAETAGRCVEQKDIDAMHEAGDLDWYIERLPL